MRFLERITLNEQRKRQLSAMGSNFQMQAQQIVYDKIIDSRLKGEKDARAEDDERD